MTLLLVITILTSFVGFQGAIIMSFYNEKGVVTSFEKTLRNAARLKNVEGRRVVRFAFDKSAKST